MIKSVCTGNHMLGRVIWDKVPKCIFENFECSSFSKITSLTYPKNRPKQTCDYLLITSNQQKLCIETDIF